MGIMQKQPCDGGISYHSQPVTNCLSCPYLKGYPISQQSCWRGNYCTCCSWDKTNYQILGQGNLILTETDKWACMGQVPLQPCKSSSLQRKSRPRTQNLCLLAEKDLGHDIYLQFKRHSSDFAFLMHAVDIQGNRNIEELSQK